MATSNSDLKRSPVPRVFISSTSEDLETYRAAAKEAALAAGKFPVMFEYFPASSATSESHLWFVPLRFIQLRNLRILRSPECHQLLTTRIFESCCISQNQILIA